ncbi:MTH1187 family thiamine-binding protein [Microaerobacter geothermalis]|uniref:MTH1187 family thiamine-binding protein n=1 Tax=Microaerobacter geothermalis TaxID=674972 RepID=UPI001F4369E7|nr:MTH1187 family thiamine-binding protein [Microaerobacter geothermalis]MCF6092992.1 MTH1187 family thiamine-binding protein [Microaerobacter geothermalis]
MPILEISVVPVGTQSTSFSSSVTNACRVIERQGLKYQVTPTATVIEGNLDQLFELAKEIHSQCFADGSTRVITNMTIDDRHDKPMSMVEQVAHVKEQLHY